MVWIEIPEVLTFEVEQDLYNNDSPLIVDLLIREGVQRQPNSRRDSLIRTSNIQKVPRETQNIQDLERHVQSLLERVSTLESIIQEKEQNPIVPPHIQKIYDEIQLQRPQHGPRSQSDNHDMSESQLSKSQKYICHTCHSDIIGDKNQSNRPESSKKHKSVNDVQIKSKQNRANSYCEKSSSAANRMENVHDTSSVSYGENGESDSHYSYEHQDTLSRMTSDQIAGNADSMSSPVDNKYKNQKKKLDLAFLYADPLVMKKKQQLLTINQPLDSEKECREIQKIISSSKKAFTMRKEALNFETLQQILMKQPKIIHISCHGDYDEESKQFYLAFEQKDTGILDKFTEDRFRKMLGNEGNHKVHLVFVSACHSELIGQIFRRAKVPVVVAVNSHSLILDDVCQLFARHFYNQLLEGYSPKIAFDEAKRVVQGSDIEKYSCCCAHDHTPSCKWQKFAKKYGYERAHEIHTPNCYCNIENNEHKVSCKFYLQFQEHLKEFEQDFDFDYFDIDEPMNLPSMQGTIKFCCCQPNQPHDESIKFLLNGDEDAKNMILFENRQDGQILLEADVNQNNKLPQVIDSQMLVGRNIELQNIVQTLFSETSSKRLIHIYGSEGVGKSALAKSAAKYTLERRKFPDGVYYIEVQNRNSGQGLLSKICQKLQLQNLSKEKLCEIIKSNHILIVIDKCKNIIEQGKVSFNKALKFLIENTIFSKIIVVTTNQDDISDDVNFKVEYPITELSNFNAAKLLISVAQNAKYLKHHQNPKDLAEHKIFKLIPNKPSGIIQIASLLNTKSLDEIVQEKESEIKRREEGRQKQEQIKQMEYGEFSWILSISYRELEAKFHIELNLLYFLCQAPGGLTEYDIEYICTEKPQIYGDWKQFLKSIDHNENQQQYIEDKNHILKRKNQQLNQKGFQIVTSNFSEELQEYHYIPQPIVTEYINTLVLNQSKKALAFQECFRYMSKLSRRLLRSLKIQKKKQYDISIVSSEIDIGIWSDTMVNAPISEEIMAQQMIYNAEVKFNYSETNFFGILDLELLKEQFPTLDYKNVCMQYLDELIVNLPSILILLNRLDEAYNIIKKIKLIVEHYQLKFDKARIYLIESSILLKLNGNYLNIKHLLEQAEKNFIDLSQYEGAGDANYLMALALINSINVKLINYPEQAINQFENVPIERSNSVNIPYEQHTFKPLLQTSSSSLNPQSSLISLNIQQSSQQLMREADGVLSSLQKAKKFFKRSNNEYGIAKSNIIEAEFQIDNCYGSGLCIDFQPKKLIQILLDSIMLYKKIGCDSLVARCLRNLAEVKNQIDENFEAKNHIEDALLIIKRIQDTHQEALASTLLNKILHKIRIKSNNVFMFTKAFPFIEVIGQSEKIVGTFTRYPSDFRRRIHDEFRKQKKLVNVKFDQLDRQALNYIKTYGCRVLHLSSDVYIQDALCIENANGEIEYLDVDQLRQILKPPIGKLNVDVVVVAIPESFKLAQLFVELGVPHVIGFDFKQTLLSTFMDNIYSLPKRYDYIYDFCVEFYKNLLQEMTVISSWKLAKPRLNDGIRRMNEKYNNSNLTKDDVGEGPVLFPRNGKHNVKLFDNVSGDQGMQLLSGQILDSSRVRGPFSVQRIGTPYTGRQFEMHKVLTHLRKVNVRMVNVVGLDGIGKSRFLSETAYYMHARYLYQDGIFMLNLRRVKTTEQIKQKLKEVNIGNGQSLDLNTNLQNKNLLLILDNVDSLIKHNKTQFDWWLQSLIQQGENIKLILSSKSNIKLKDCAKLETEARFVKLKPLNDIEAVDMILTNCNRRITLDELQLSNDSRRNIHTQLQQESSVKRCYGFPKYLEIFAQYLEYHSFDRIDIKNYIPTSKRGQMRKLQKEQQSIGGILQKKRLKRKEANANSPSQDKYLNAKNSVINKDQIRRSEPKTTVLQVPTDNYFEERRIKKPSYDERDVIIEEEEELAESASNMPNQRPRLDTVEEEKLVMDFPGFKDAESLMDDGEEYDDQPKDDDFFNYDKSEQRPTINSFDSRKQSSCMGKTDNSSDNEEHGVKVSKVYKNEKHINLYKSDGGESNAYQIQEMIQSRQRERQMRPSILINNAQSSNRPVTVDDFDNGSRQDSLFNNIKMIQEYQKFGRMSVDHKNYNKPEKPSYELSDEDVAKIELSFPVMHRVDSVTSQAFDQQSEQRSRSGSEIFMDNLNNLRQSRTDEMRISLYQKGCQNSKVEEKQEEEDQTDSKVHSDYGDHQLSGAPQGSSNFTQPMQFDFDEAKSCHSEEVEHNEYMDDDDFVDEFEPLTQSDFTKHQSQSFFTTSSGNKNNSRTSIIMNKQQSMQEMKQQKERLRLRKELGPKSSKHTRKYKKQTKNKFQEVQEKKFDQKKSQKQQKFDRLQGQLQKQKSSGSLIESGKKLDEGGYDEDEDVKKEINKQVCELKDSGNKSGKKNKKKNNNDNDNQEY